MGKDQKKDRETSKIVGGLISKQRTGRDQKQVRGEPSHVPPPPEVPPAPPRKRPSKKEGKSSGD